MTAAQKRFGNVLAEAKKNYAKDKSKPWKKHVSEAWKKIKK